MSSCFCENSKYYTSNKVEGYKIVVVAAVSYSGIMFFGWFIDFSIMQYCLYGMCTMHNEVYVSVIIFLWILFFLAWSNEKKTY